MRRRAAAAAPPPRWWRRWRSRRPATRRARLAGSARLPAARAERAAHPGAGDQPRARLDVLDHRPGDAACSARTWPQGRRLRRDPRAAAALRRRPGVRHAARRAGDPRARARAAGCPGCCRCRRSSTSPTCTTPRTSCAARRRRCSSSPTAQYRNPMVVRIAATPTSAASAATSTTTTRSPCCATSRGSSSPRRPARTTPRRCCGPAWPRPRVDGAVCVFLEPIALYHDADLHADGDDGWLAPYPDWLPRPVGTGSQLRRRHRPHARDVRQRGADEPAGGAPAAGRRACGAAWSTCAGWRRCPIEDVLREAEVTRPGAGRGRDAAHRRGLRGGGRRAGRRRVHRAHGPGDQRRTASSRSATPH